MKSFTNSQDALLYLMTNRFTHHLDDKHGNSYYHGQGNTIDVEIWEDQGDGTLDMVDVEIISYEDFIKRYDGVELFEEKNI